MICEITPCLHITYLGRKRCVGFRIIRRISVHVVPRYIHGSCQWHSDPCYDRFTSRFRTTTGNVLRLLIRYVRTPVRFPALLLDCTDIATYVKQIISEIIHYLTLCCIKCGVEVYLRVGSFCCFVCCAGR